MAHRMFSDATGREWLVWDVVPQSPDRREVADRRIEEAGHDRRRDAEVESEVFLDSGIDRRIGVSRRSLTDRRLDHDSSAARPARTFSHLPTAYSSGWLCFESGSERRRLGPTPPEWDAMSEVELRELLEHATRVSAARPSLDTAKMRAMVKRPGEQRL